MIALLLIPFVAACLTLGRSAPRLARSWPPAVAVWTLAAAALALALATGLMLCALATLALFEFPASARLGHWSADVLADAAPVPPQIGLPITLAAAVLLVAALLRAGHGAGNLVSAARHGRRLGPAAGGLIVVDDTHCAAFVVPGRMVLTSALLRRLDAGERRAVLAHEESHLRHRHYLHVQLAAVAAAANPLLRPVVPAVRLAVERAADEDAAGVVGDRRTVARALARAGTAVRHPSGALCMAETEVATRVRQLLAPQPQPLNMTGVAGWLVLAAGTLVASAAFGLAAHNWFEAAQAAYHR